MSGINGMSGEAAAGMTSAEAGVTSAEAAVAAPAGSMTASAALRADRHYRDDKEERREGQRATHGAIIRHFSGRKSSKFRAGRRFQAERRRRPDDLSSMPSYFFFPAFLPALGAASPARDTTRSPLRNPLAAPKQINSASSLPVPTTALSRSWRARSRMSPRTDAGDFPAAGGRDPCRSASERSTFPEAGGRFTSRTSDLL